MWETGRERPGWCFFGARMVHLRSCEGSISTRYFQEFRMSTKRRAATELTKDNWDDEEEEKQEAGCFQVASDDDLNKRKIIKAKRRTTAENQGGGVFQGFKGFSGFSTSTLPKPKIPLSSSNTFTSTLGSASTTVSEASSKPPQLDVVSNTTAVKNPPETSSSNTNGSGEDNSSYLEQIKALNQSVVTWIQSHVTSNPYIDLTPVFKDYENHMKNIDNKCCAAGSSSGSLSSAATSSMFGAVKSSAVTSSMFSTAQSSVASSSMFGSTQPTVGTTSMFGSTQPSVGTSSMFGSTQLCVSSAPSSSGAGKKFGVGSDETAAQSDAHVTSSASSSTQETGNGNVAPNSAGNAGEQSKDEEDEEPCKPDKVAGPEDGAFYSVRCKLYFKRGSAWSELGVGMINLKDIDGKTQILMRNDTSLGKILLNVFLASNTPVSRSGKNNVMLVSVPNPPLYSKANEGDNSKPATYLIRVKTSDDADKLHQELISKKESSS